LGAKAMLLSPAAESVSGLILPFDAGIIIGASAGPGQPAFVSLPQDDPANAAPAQPDPTTLAVASPSERGLSAILEALRDDDVSSQILRANAALRDMQPVLGPGDEDDRAPALASDALDHTAARPDATAKDDVSQPFTASVSPDRVVEMTADGASLRDEARALLKVRRKESEAHARAVADAADWADDSAGLSLGDRLLDSRLLGEALASAVQLKLSISGDTTFSVFGQGQFELDLSSDTRTITVSELTTETSFTLPTQDDQGFPAPRQPHEKIDLLQIALNFLTTPAGTLLTITASVLLLIYGMVRAAMMLRR
jgi:hypothetical protein